jgi:hypothetical protein
MAKWPEFYSGSTVGGREKASKEVDACDWVLVEFVASQLSNQGEYKAFSQ